MRKAKLLIILVGLTAFLLSGCISKIRQISLTPEIAAEALHYALSAEGAPYVWGGNGPDEFDCSGLLVWSYRQAYPDIMFRIGNEKVSDVAMDDIWKYNTIPILPRDLSPGDIVFITSSETEMTHGGLFIEWIDDSTFKFINASSSHQAVAIDEWPIIGTVRDQWFAGAGRLQTVY